MKFPTITDAIKALVIALLLAIIGFFLYPSLEPADPREAFVIALAVGAFLGAILVRFQRRAGNSTDTASSEMVSLFVGNLAFKASQDELRELFSPYGTVHSVRIMKDRATRRPRGFAFIEIDGKKSEKAIRELNGKEFHGRTLRVNESSNRQQNTD